MQQAATMAVAKGAAAPLINYLPKHFGWKAAIIAAAYFETKGTITLIQGPSMYPTLNTDQRSKIPDLVWSKADFKPEDLQIGDIVIFDSPLKQGYNFCKRIASLEDTFVYSSESPVPVYVPPGHFWALGDNPRNSHDSDQFGPVSQSLIKGVVTLRIYPWSTDAVKRKIVSREVNYHDPLVLLQEQFDKYKADQKRQEDESGLLSKPINYISSMVWGSGSGDTTQDTTIIGQNDPTTPAPSAPFPNESHVPVLSDEDIAFNRYQRQEAERHLQLLLNENKQHTQVETAINHNAHREQFLRNAGKWRESDDYDDQPIDTNNLYNPFEARYGPIR